MGYGKFAPMTPDILVRKGEAMPSPLVVPVGPPASVSPLYGSPRPNAPERFAGAAPRENRAAELQAGVEDAYRRWRAKHENDFATAGHALNDPPRETPSAPHIHSAGQIPRCFAMKENFTCFGVAL